MKKGIRNLMDKQALKGKELRLLNPKAPRYIDIKDIDAFIEKNKSVIV